MYASKILFYQTAFLARCEMHSKMIIWIVHLKIKPSRSIPNKFWVILSKFFHDTLIFFKNNIMKIK